MRRTLKPRIRTAARVYEKHGLIWDHFESNEEFLIFWVRRGPDRRDSPRSRPIDSLVSPSLWHSAKSSDRISSITFRCHQSPRSPLIALFSQPPWDFDRHSRALCNCWLEISHVLLLMLTNDESLLFHFASLVYLKKSSTDIIPNQRYSMEMNIQKCLSVIWSVNWNICDRYVIVRLLTTFLTKPGIKYTGMESNQQFAEFVLHKTVWLSFIPWSILNSQPQIVFGDVEARLTVSQATGKPFYYPVWYVDCPMQVIGFLIR